MGLPWRLYFRKDPVKGSTGLYTRVDFVDRKSPKVKALNACVREHLRENIEEVLKEEKIDSLAKWKAAGPAIRAKVIRKALAKTAKYCKGTSEVKEAVSTKRAPVIERMLS